MHVLDVCVILMRIERIDGRRKVMPNAIHSKECIECTKSAAIVFNKFDPFEFSLPLFCSSQSTKAEYVELSNLIRMVLMCSNRK